MQQHMYRYKSMFRGRQLLQRTAALFLIVLLLVSTAQVTLQPLLAQARAESLSSLAQGKAPSSRTNLRAGNDRRQEAAGFKTAPGVNDPGLAPTTDAAKATASSGLMKLTHKTPETEKGAEETDKRTPFSTTYQNKKGGEITEVTSMPSNYQDKDKKLTAIKSSLREDQSYAKRNKESESVWDRIMPGTQQPLAFVAENGSIKAHFETIGKGGIRLVLDGKALTLHPKTDRRVRPQKETDKRGNTYVIYKNVWDNVDLLYEYHGVTIKENIIIRKASATGSFKFDVQGAPIRGSADGKEILVGGDFEGRLKFGGVSVQAGKSGVQSKAPIKQTAAAGNVIAVDLKTDWIAKQSKDSFPIVIDPAPVDLYGIPGGAQGQYFSYKSDGYSCNWTNCPINVGGLNDGGAKHWRSMMRLPFDNASGRQLLGADIYLPMSVNPNWWNGTYDTRTVWVTWAPCFGYNCTNGGAPVIAGQVSSTGQFSITPLIQWMIDNGQWGGWLMVWGENTTSSFKRFEAAGVRLVLYTNRHPGQPVPELPSNNPHATTTVTSTVPQLQVSKTNDPDGEQVHYQFTLSSASGGTVWQSDPTPSRQAIIPDGILQDGSTYRWSYKYAEHAGGSSYYWISGDIHGGSFTVTLPNDKDNTQSYDTVGPVTVSMNSGKAYLSASTHSIAALGGDIGLSLDYTSPLASKPGLVAEYYNGTEEGGGEGPQYRRVEPNINNNWDLGSPVPGVIGTDSYRVYWTGFFVAPTDGDYYFGGTNDDEFSVHIGDVGTVLILNCCSALSWSGTPVHLKAGEQVPISVTHKEYTSTAYASLWVRGPVSEQIVPSEWLRTAPMPTSQFTGLTGHYYYDDGSHNPTAANKFLEREDQRVNFVWGEGAIAPGMPADNFYVRWEGYFTAPTAGVYKFGVGGDDGIKVTVDGAERAAMWYPHAYQEHYDQEGMMLTEDQTVPIIVDYYETGGGAAAKLLVDGPTGRGLVDNTHLSTKGKPLSRGWNLSADPDGTLAYERLTLRQNGDVIIYDGDGSSHLFAQTGNSYKPPAGQDSLLIRNTDGTYTLTGADGRIYVFNLDGTLKLTSIPTDDAKPAALQYEYATQNGVPRLKRIVDAVNPSRYGTLHYGGDSACRAPVEDFDITIDPNLLCGFETSDGQYTQLMYWQGRLEYIRNPGNEDTMMYYNAEGLVQTVRDSLNQDILNAGLYQSGSLPSTLIRYDELARVSKITAPSPTEDRVEHTFEYLQGATKRHINGLPEPHGYQQYIEFDAQGRTTKSCDNMAVCSRTEYDPVKDLVLATYEPTGLKSTTIYDDEDRPIRSYGPGLDWWFEPNREPLAEYKDDMPFTETGYDENISGPEATYYSYYSSDPSRPQGGTLIKAPKLHATGINTTPGILDKTWTSSPIAAESGMHGWGVRLTGKLRLPASGTYAISLQHTEGAKLWLDDNLAIDAWSDGTMRTESEYRFTYTAGQAPIRFTLDQYNKYGTTSPTLKVFLKQDNGFDWTTNWTNYLKPAYGLPTSNIAHDAQVGDSHTKTTYSNPALGISSGTTTDPAGLSYLNKATYETVGSGYLRQLSKTSPGGSVTTYQHYGALDTKDNPCTTTVTEAYKQAGFPKSRIDVDPDGSGSIAARKTEVIYDNAGREVAFRMGTEAWTCTYYDERGRTNRITIPTVGARAGRTITYTYALDGDPRKSKIEDSSGYTTERVDSLGRIVEFRDTLGNITTTSYNGFGQIASRTSALGALTYTYDNYGRLTDYWNDGTKLAHLNYDAFGRMAEVTYPSIKDPVTNKVLTLHAPPRDFSERVLGVRFTLPNQSELYSLVNRSQSGAVLKEYINRVQLSPTDTTYQYDKAGRITKAELAGHTYEYDFANANAACASKPNNFVNAGKNSNRLQSKVDGVATWYCYDGADRLIASSNAAFDVPTYDTHGNTLTLGTGTSTTTFKYDQSDRNIEISQGTALKVAYKRDHENRLTQRKVTKSGSTSTYYYGSTGGSEYTFMYTNATTKAVVEKYLSLPGGVQLTIRPAETTTAKKTKVTLPNIHGHTMAVLNGLGVNETGVMLYDPFGNQIAPTAAFASANPGITFASLTTAADNAKGDQSATWASAYRRNKEVLFAVNPMQMGARVYIPGLGRFLSVDPVDGGALNNYVYAMDPINTKDYSGEFVMVLALPFLASAAQAAFAVAAATAVVITTYAVVSLIASRSTSTPVSSPADTGSGKSGSSSNPAPSRGGGSSNSPSSPKPPSRDPKGVKKAAQDLAKKIQRNSYKITKPEGTYRFDLTGRAHFNKPTKYSPADQKGPWMGKKVETPHKTFRPNDPINRTGKGKEGPAEPMNWDDIATILRHMSGQ